MPRSTTWMARSWAHSPGWSAVPHSSPMKPRAVEAAGGGEGRGGMNGLATGLWSQSCEAELQDLGKKRLISAFQPSQLYRTGRCGG